MIEYIYKDIQNSVNINSNQIVITSLRNIDVYLFDIKLY